MTTRFTGIKIGHSGAFSGEEGPNAFGANFPLFLISEAWHTGCNYEDLADGFGLGIGTAGGDWSGIRDSSEAAKERMLERALNHLFPRPEALRHPLRKIDDPGATVDACPTLALTVTVDADVANEFEAIEGTDVATYLSGEVTRVIEAALDSDNFAEGLILRYRAFHVTVETQEAN